LRREPTGAAKWGRSAGCLSLGTLRGRTGDQAAVRGPDVIPSARRRLLTLCPPWGRHLLTPYIAQKAKRPCHAATKRQGQGSVDGAASATTLSGFEVIFAGASATSTTVTSTGYQYILPGAVASNTHCSPRRHPKRRRYRRQHHSVGHPDRIRRGGRQRPDN